MKKIFYLIIVMLFGIFMLVYGEFDDSPGGQLLGLIAFIVGIVSLIKLKANDYKK